MNALPYFKILSEEIHSTVIATLDHNALPSTRVIDIMLYDDQGLYFLTAKGKNFYQQLMNHGYISLSAITSGAGTMNKKAISIRGFAKNIGTEKLDAIFEKNPYMAEIYPTDKSRLALEVFCIYKGQGEFFDLSTKPISRANFSFGGLQTHSFGYLITEHCKGCGTCLESCPQQCIIPGDPYQIKQEHCLHCGNCYKACPNRAIIKMGDEEKISS